MQRFIQFLILATVVVVASVGTHATAREPDQVVREYVAAFKGKDKAAMLSCLSEVFFDDYKVKYLAKVEAYDQQKLKFALEIYEVDSIDQLRGMSGEAILSKFLDTPVSEAYWRGFDSIDLIMDVEKGAVSADQATVRSWIYTKTSLPVKVETTYSLAKRNGEWRIDRFQRKTIKP